MDPAKESTLRVRDLVRAAFLLLDAVEGAPDRSLTTVETAFGRAEVVATETGVDVVLHDRNATVHVRSCEGEDPGDLL